MKIILASTSKFRKKLLTDYGLPFEAVAPDFDEDAHKISNVPVEHLCELLAEGKAKSLLNKYPNDIIIGSDQMAALGNIIIGKAGTPEKAVEQLLSMQGKTHKLVTSVCVLVKGRKYLFSDVTEMKMRALNKDQITKYVKHDETWDCAGSYKLEKSGRALFESIQCKDETAIIGLPVMSITEILINEGFQFPFL